jgi:NADPH-dependent glutamate synthase beta subunit-like oxidoreductase
MFRVDSKEEAIEWVKRCPDPVPGGEYEIEIRQVFEASDFETMTPELREQEERLRATIESPDAVPPKRNSPSLMIGNTEPELDLAAF